MVPTLATQMGPCLFSMMRLMMMMMIMLMMLSSKMRSVLVHLERNSMMTTNSKVVKVFEVSKAGK